MSNEEAPVWILPPPFKWPHFEAGIIPAIRVLVSVLFTELPIPRRDDAGTGTLCRSRHHLSLGADIERLLRDWSRIAVEVTATNKSKVKERRPPFVVEPITFGYLTFTAF